jgi:hypothetical protein
MTLSLVYNLLPSTCAETALIQQLAQKPAIGG